MTEQIKKRSRKPSLKQKRALANLVENGGNVSKAMVDAGYSPTTAKTPQKLTESEAWKGMMADYLPDTDIAKVHQQLLGSRRLDHMTFPLGLSGDEGEDPENDTDSPLEDLGLKERTDLTDKEIKQLLLEVNCIVRRIVHGEQARHVYFWSPDNKARQAALDMAYKLKARYPKEGSGVAVAVQVNVDQIRDEFK